MKYRMLYDAGVKITFDSGIIFDIPEFLQFRMIGFQVEIMLKTVKPFIKWAGGKSRLLNIIREKYLKK